MLLLALNELFFSFTNFAKRRRRKSHFGCNNKYLHIIDFFSLLLYRSSRENFGLRCYQEVRIKVYDAAVEKCVDDKTLRIKQYRQSFCLVSLDWHIRLRRAKSGVD